MNTSIVLVCSVLASLAAGVLLAYGIFQAMFAMFRMHVRQVAVLAKPAVAVPAVVVEG